MRSTKSANQIIKGNYTEDVTILGTAGQIATGVLGVDLPGDIRDITHDLTHWEWSWKHAGKTALDVVGVLPLVGGLKYTDEAAQLLKNSGNAADAVKSASKAASSATDAAKTIDKSADLAKTTAKTSIDIQEAQISQKLCHYNLHCLS